MFVSRPPGEKTAHVGGRPAPVDEATHVVLEARDGRVLVKSIRPQGDGTFIGEIYGVMPRQRSVAVGDLVQFHEAHVLMFRTPQHAASVSTAPDADMAEMARRFDEGFGEFASPPGDEAQGAPSITAGDLFRIDAAAGDNQRVEPPPVEAPRAVVIPIAEVPAAPSPARLDDIREESSIDKTDHMLRTPKEKSPPLVTERSEQMKRVEPSNPAEVPPAAAAAAEGQPFKCVECGTKLFASPPPEGDAPEALKVACPACGRINTPPRT